MGLFQKLFGAKPKKKKEEEIKEEPSLIIKEEKIEAKDAAPEIKAEEISTVTIAEEIKEVATPEVAEETEEPAAEAAPTAEEEAKEASVAPAPKKRAPAKKPSATKKVDEKPAEVKEEAIEELAEPAVEEPQKAQKTGKFEIKKAKDGRFVFNLYASNHVIVATSQIYSSSTSAVNGIKSIIANAERAGVEDQTLKTFEPVPYPKWEIYEDKSGQYRFRLCAPNGSCIVHSQGYTSKASCKNGIESIIKTSKNAEIDKSYLKKD